MLILLSPSAPSSDRCYGTAPRQAMRPWQGGCNGSGRAGRETARQQAGKAGWRMEEFSQVRASQVSSRRQNWVGREGSRWKAQQPRMCKHHVAASVHSPLITAKAPAGRLHTLPAHRCRACAGGSKAPGTPASPLHGGRAPGCGTRAAYCAVAAGAGAPALALPVCGVKWMRTSGYAWPRTLTPAGPHCAVRRGGTRGRVRRAGGLRGCCGYTPQRRAPAGLPAPTGLGCLAPSHKLACAAAARPPPRHNALPKPCLPYRPTKPRT